jgi:hypothetical protein
MSTQLSDATQRLRYLAATGYLANGLGCLAAIEVGIMTKFTWRRSNLVFLAASFLLLVGVLPGCVTTGTGSATKAPAEVEPGVPFQKLAVPPAHYSWLTWADESRLVLVSPASDMGLENRYEVLNDGLLQELALPGDPICQHALTYQFPATLPDGRLGLVKWCITQWPTQSEEDSLQYLVAYDWQTESIEQIVSGPLPDIGANDFSWNPDMSRGVQAAGSLFQTLYWLAPDGVEPMTITISRGRRSWSLDENYYSMLNRDNNHDIGIARAPSWSPDGQTIAFFASPAAVGRSGQSRAMGEYQLYLMDPNELEPRPALAGVYYAHRLHWSPDNQWLLFTGEAGPRRIKGIWLFSPAQNDLELIAEGSFRDIAWSPDGLKVTAIHCRQEDWPECKQQEILQFDVSEVIKEAE